MDKSSRFSDVDRISKLPDEVLHYILSFLPTKHAVATSILSSRWIGLWVSLPVLDFDEFLYLDGSRWGRRSSNFKTFVDRVLSVNKSPNITMFRLKIRVAHEKDRYLAYANEWIQTVLQRNVVEVRIDICGDHPPRDEYLRIMPSQSLEVLKVCSACDVYMPTSGDCFPNLRILDLYGRLETIHDEVGMKLFPSLPQLEKLSLFVEGALETGTIHFNIAGTALKTLDVVFKESYKSDYLNYDLDVDEVDVGVFAYVRPRPNRRQDCYVNVEIDAPHLESLHLRDENFIVSYTVKNLPPSCEVKLDAKLVDVGESWKEDLCYEGDRYPWQLPIQLLHEISNAAYLSMTMKTTRALMHAYDKYVPMFHLLVKLDMTLYPRGWNLFLHWLHSFPNLKFLVLEKENCWNGSSHERYWSAPKSVPTCLLLHLKEVEIRRLEKKEEDKLLKYLLANAKVLEKITVNSRLISM